MFDGKLNRIWKVLTPELLKEMMAERDQLKTALSAFVQAERFRKAYDGVKKAAAAEIAECAWDELQRVRAACRYFLPDARGLSSMLQGCDESDVRVISQVVVANNARIIFSEGGAEVLRKAISSAKLADFSTAWLNRQVRYKKAFHA